MSALKRWFFSPEKVIRTFILLLIVLGMVCYFFPYMTLSPNTQKGITLIYSIISQIQGNEPDIPSPRKLSGFQLIFAFLGDEIELIKDKPISVEKIGPLPCNVYCAAAFLLAAAAIVLTLIRRFIRWKDLAAAGCTGLAFLLLLIGRLRFVGFYVDWAKNGDILGTWIRDGWLTIETGVWMVLSMTFFFLASFASILLASQMRHDPLFAKGDHIEG